METLDSKQEQIIEAAIKRFSHFGISKTTVNEIAEDLSISKALLYYYFPDKTSLIIGVIKSIFSEVLNEMQKKLSNSKTIKDGLFGIIDTRIEIGKKYFMMHVADGQSNINFEDPKLKEIINEFKEKETKLISEFLNFGVKKSELKEIDCETVAQLLLDIISGIWNNELHVKCKILIPNQEQFDIINKKNKQIIEILYDGIANN